MKVLGVFFLFLQVTNALHFYLETGESRCFFEELPKDHLVVAKVEALEYDQSTKSFNKNKNLRLEFTVDVCIKLTLRLLLPSVNPYTNPSLIGNF